jgi:phosphosulfolactate synthase
MKVKDLLRLRKGELMEYLTLPHREAKPRKKGLTILIDNGYPPAFFIDVLTSYGDYIDFVKFGWGTSVISKNLKYKIDVLHANNIDFFFGGTLFEKFFYQNKIEAYRTFLNMHGCQYVEISNGTVALSNERKAEYISTFSKDYIVFSEVGLKDAQKSEEMSPQKWIKYINQDFESGAFKVITEARESGTSGICRSSGDIRLGLFEEISESGIDMNDLIFEAPNKKMQIYFIQKLGSNCNLANIAFSDVIALETLRLGLRSDTFFEFE